MFVKRIRNQARATRLLNLVAAFSVVLPAITVGEYLYYSRVEASGPTPAPKTAQTRSLVGADDSYPDVYYIILDAYGRADFLEERYDHDNSEFVNFLRDRGFFVAEKSRTNYVWTSLSLASSLNMDYLQDLGLEVTLRKYPSGMEEPIKRSRVRHLLESSGYLTVALASGYRPTELFDADKYLIPDMGIVERLQSYGAFNAFEGLLLHTSAGLILVDLDQLRNTPVSNFIVQRLEYPKRMQRQIILASFDHLETVSDIPGPKFVFAHIISPHKPYYFGPNGEDVLNAEPFTLAETGAAPGGEHGLRYRDQLVYVNTRIQAIIDAILSRSAHPPIIVLQADHGPGIGMDWNSPDEASLLDRASILNAYFLPGDCGDRLYPSITPVNTFRVIMSCYFGVSLDPLEDVTYFSNARVEAAYDFVVLEEMLD